MFLHLLLVRFPDSLDCESRSLETWLAFAQLSTCWSVGVCVCSKLGCKMTAVMCCFWKGCFVSSWGRRASSGLGREGGTHLFANLTPLLALITGHIIISLWFTDGPSQSLLWFYWVFIQATTTWTIRFQKMISRSRRKHFQYIVFVNTRFSKSKSTCHL